MAVLGSVAGLATWLGVAVTGAGLSLWAALAGVWNTLPIALLSVGAAVLAIGWLPRFTGAIGVVPTVGGFLLQVVAQSAGAPRWVIDLSPYAHLAPVPLDGPNLVAAAVMTILAVALAVVGHGRVRRARPPPLNAVSATRRTARPDMLHRRGNSAGSLTAATGAPGTPRRRPANVWPPAPALGSYDPNELTRGRGV